MKHFALAVPLDFQRRLLARRTPSIQLNVDGTRLRPVFTRSDSIQTIISDEVRAFRRAV